MCKLKTTLWINTVIFSVIGLLHLVRMLLQWPAQIGSWNVPLWLSGVGVIVAAVLVYCNGKHLAGKE